MNTHRSDTCALVRAAVPLLAGNDLEPEALESARQHLESCRACASALEGAREARAALAQLRVERPAPDLWVGVRAALLAEGWIRGATPAAAPRSAAQALPRLRRRAPRLLVASLAAAGLLSVALWGALSLGNKPAGGITDSEGIAQPGPLPTLPRSQDPSSVERDATAMQPTPGRADRGLRLVSGAPSGPGGSLVAVPVRQVPWNAAEPEAECADPFGGDLGPQALRPSSDQHPRRTVYFQPEGLQGEAIDVRQLRRPGLPFGGRAAAGLQTAGGQP